eukprot:TRINITY_DN2461_c0_g1_i3.p1 TRINITY_DN2461_c0_g1~~TRINITY_DN2461_c0_g1_i3.p1  ORF type:complete len:373 (+),score=80.31 TRINITY_DN2461_c0_g1_i3:72-1121(+)
MNGDVQRSLSCKNLGLEFITALGREIHTLQEQLADLPERVRCTEEQLVSLREENDILKQRIKDLEERVPSVACSVDERCADAFWETGRAAPSPPQRSNVGGVAVAPSAPVVTSAGGFAVGNGANVENVVPPFTSTRCVESQDEVLDPMTRNDPWGAALHSNDKCEGWAKKSPLQTTAAATLPVKAPPAMLPSRAVQNQADPALLVKSQPPSLIKSPPPDPMKAPAPLLTKSPPPEHAKAPPGLARASPPELPKSDGQLLVKAPPSILTKAPPGQTYSSVPPVAAATASVDVLSLDGGLPTVASAEKMPPEPSASAAAMCVPPPVPPKLLVKAPPANMSAHLRKAPPPMR